MTRETTREAADVVYKLARSILNALENRGTIKVLDSHKAQFYLSALIGNAMANVAAEITKETRP